MNKKIKFIAPILVLAGSYFLVQVMVASKPEPEKKESIERTLSLYVSPVEKTRRSI
ncbi:MAG: efflux RND transporter periplasmic adaptor subunit, partial [Proteobacteria bacterium]